MLVATSLASHPYKDAAILLDLGIFTMVILSIGIAFISGLLRISGYDRNWLKPYLLCSSRRKIAAASGIGFGFVVMMAGLLHFPTLTLPPHYTIIATLWGYGLGAAFQTFGFCYLPLMFCPVASYIGGRRSLHTEVNDEQ